MDEAVFADGVVTHFGQIVGVVLAESQPLAQRAAQTVSITYDDLPSVITIEVRMGIRQYWGEWWSVVSFQTLVPIPFHFPRMR